MFHAFLSSIVMLTCLIQGSDKVQFSIGANYSSYKLFQDSDIGNTKSGWGGEIGVYNIIPNIGLNFRAARLRFYTPIEESYEYIPLTLCTSFNLLPFLNLEWLKLSLETGFGIYFWKGYWIDQVIVLPNGETMDEKDIGFVGGFTLQVKPFKFIALEYVTRYNYIASADIYKYGFEDKDEKLWENGIGLKIIIP